MRTQDEIVARYEAAKNGDVLGFKADVLVGHMDYEHARPYLKPEVTAADWTPDAVDDASLLDELRSYMEFAWDKAIGHRGISSERSVQKLTEMAWLTGHDGAVKDADEAPYTNYGAPKLAAICRAFELPIPDGEGVRNMIEGRPCEPHCIEGCGS